MNRSNGGRFPQRGPVSRIGQHVPTGRGLVTMQAPNYPRMPQGRPPTMGGNGPRIPPPVNAPPGMMFPGQRAPIPPPPIRPPHIPPGGRPQNQIYRRSPVGPPLPINQQPPFQRPPVHSRGVPMVVRPLISGQMQPPYVPAINSAIPSLPMNSNRIPPPHPLKPSYYPQNPNIKHYGASQSVVQLNPVPIPPAIHEPLGGMASASTSSISQYNQNFHQHNLPNHPPPPFVAALKGAVPPTQYTKAQIEDAWTEHVAPNGVSYYHNHILQSSTYDKPECLKANGTASKVSGEASLENDKPWQQYVDASTGKFYYSNGVITTWEKPEGFKSVNDHDLSNDIEPPKKKKKAIQNVIEFSSKEEAVAVFKGLLLEKEISPSAKWNDVSKACLSDPKWEACENYLTTGERKQALAEYQTKRANDLKEYERQEKIRIKEAFLQLLTDKLPDLKNFSAWTSRFEDVRELLTGDNRFQAVANESTRQSLFLDFCEEFKKREERRKRTKKREAQDAFDSFLTEKEKIGVLTFVSTWNTFTSSLDDKDLQDARFETSTFMSDSDRQLYFADHVIKLQKTEDERRNRFRGGRNRAEKAQQEAFLDSLHELARAGKIVPGSSWRRVEPLIASLPTYVTVYDQGRDTPRDIFEEFIADWNESYRRDRAILSQLVSPNTGKIVVSSRTTIEDFYKSLLDAADDSPETYRQIRKIINQSDTTSSARLYFEELQVDLTKEMTSTEFTRRGSLTRRRADSSEDEGEIFEDGEIEG